MSKTKRHLSQVIPLTEAQVIEEPPARGRRAKSSAGKSLLIGATAKMAFAVAGAYSLVHFAEIGRQWCLEQYAEARMWVFDTIDHYRGGDLSPVAADSVTPTETSVAEVIARTSREHGIDPMIMKVIAIKESSGGKALYRFEPDLYSRLRRKLKGTDDEVRMLASSHGTFHVLGITAREACGLHWSKLYDIEESGRCAASYVAKVWDETSHIRNTQERLWETFKRYNGSGPSAEAYANDAMGKLASLLYVGMVKRNNG